MHYFFRRIGHRDADIIFYGHSRITIDREHITS